MTSEHKEWKGRVAKVTSSSGAFQIDEAPGKRFMVKAGARGITLTMDQLGSRIVFQETRVEAAGMVVVDNVRNIRTGQITSVYGEEKGYLHLAIDGFRCVTAINEDGQELVRRGEKPRTANATVDYVQTGQESDNLSIIRIIEIY